MIKLDLQKAKIKKDMLLSQQSRVDKLHNKFIEDVNNNAKWHGWVNYPTNLNVDELRHMKAKITEMKARGIKELLVIGIGGSFLGSSAAIDFVKGKYWPGKNVHFAGVDLSTSHIRDIEEKLRGTEWGICVISKSGGTLEPALVFRHFKNLLKAKYGDEYNNNVIAVTSRGQGKLWEISQIRNYTTYEIPDSIGGRFSGLTPGGTFPMMWAGLDVAEVINGARLAQKKLLSTSNLMKNEAYKYAVARYLLNRNRFWGYRNQKGMSLVKMSKRYDMEIMTTYDSDLQQLTNWWIQLFGESEGKKNKGIYATKSFNTTDLHSLGQAIQEGKKIFFETTLWIDQQSAPGEEIEIPSTSDDLDGLNYLAGKTIEEVNKKAFKAVYEAHSNSANTPNLILFGEKKDERTYGYIMYFFWIAVTMSAKLNRINPFDQPGVEVYKKNLEKELKKD